ARALDRAGPGPAGPRAGPRAGGGAAGPRADPRATSGPARASEPGPTPPGVGRSARSRARSRACSRSRGSARSDARRAGVREPDRAARGRRADDGGDPVDRSAGGGRPRPRVPGRRAGRAPQADPRRAWRDAHVLLGPGHGGALLALISAALAEPLVYDGDP